MFLSDCKKAGDSSVAVVLGICVKARLSLIKKGGRKPAALDVKQVELLSFNY